MEQKHGKCKKAQNFLDNLNCQNIAFPNLLLHLPCNNKTMPCKTCQGKSKDGSPCKRKASCEIDCHIFCWQHAEKWSKTKGCTSKKLYQYRKKPGPKSGECGPDKMIGASGRCVKRTPDNLKAKKKALAKRNLGSSDVKRGRKKDEEPPFIEIEEISESPEIPVEISDDESLETEEAGSSDIRDLRECRADLERLRLEYESRKEASLQKLVKLQEEHDARVSELSEQKGSVETCERNLNNLRREYQEQRESNNRELSVLRGDLQDHQKVISEKEQEKSFLEQEVELLSQRLLSQGIDEERRVEQAMDKYKKLIEDKDKDIEKEKLDFASLFQKYNVLKESTEKELGKIRVKMSKQEESLRVCQEDVQDCEDGIDKLDRDYEEKLSASRKELGEIQTKYNLQQTALLDKEGDLKECNDAFDEQAKQFDEQQRVDTERIGTLKRDLGEKEANIYDKSRNLERCKEDYVKLEKKLGEVEQKQKQDYELYRQALEKVWQDCQKQVQETTKVEREECNVKIGEEKEKVQRIRENYQKDKDKHELYIKSLEEKNIGLEEKNIGLEEQIERLKSECENDLKLFKNETLKTVEIINRKCQDQIRLAVETETVSLNETIARLIKDLEGERRMREELVREYEGKLQTLIEKYVNYVKADLNNRSKTDNKRARDLKKAAESDRQFVPKKQELFKEYQEREEKHRKEGIVDEDHLRRMKMCERRLENYINSIESREKRSNELFRSAKQLRERSENITERDL